MSVRRTPVAALQAIETPKDRECQRFGCTRTRIEAVRFEGDSTTRVLCASCKREFLGVSS